MTPLVQQQVEIRVTLLRTYPIWQTTRALAKQEAIKRAMRDFNVPRSAVDARVLDEVVG
mgnify:CR=1 FL=1